MKKDWGIFCMEKEVERIKEEIERNGYEVFEVRKLSFWEKLTYCKDPVLFANDPWVVMFRSTRVGYYKLLLKMKLVPVM